MHQGYCPPPFGWNETLLNWGGGGGGWSVKHRASRLHHMMDKLALPVNGNFLEFSMPEISFSKVFFHVDNIILSKGDGEKKTAFIKLCQFINAALLVLILPTMLLFEWVKPFLPKKSPS